MEIKAVEKRVMELFYQISAIPRPPYHEDKIADFICEMARENGHEVYRDGVHNVLVNIKASEGCEDIAPILLQGHTDMVCEKNAGVEHDFLTEGIKLYEENGILRARGTTLGADNGVAVAIMLYVIEGGIGRHGAIQCLFTTSEEVGLDGVKSFDFSRIYANRMINMDGENEHCVIVGCAGGVRSDVSFKTEYTDASGEGLRITLKGLMGGHSGENIASGRANANVLLGRLLSEIYYECTLNIVSISGGTKENAIPRESCAVIATNDRERAENIAREFEKQIRREVSCDDLPFEVITEKVELGKRMMNADTTRRILAYISCIKNGIIEMHKKLSGLVEYSRNLGIIVTEEDKVVVSLNSRSAIDAQLDLAQREIELLASVCGATVSHNGRYPGWDGGSESPLADEYIEICRRLYGTEVKKELIHAGLECGVIKAAVGELDCISCGPNMKNLHSPDESLDIESFGKYAYAICKMIEA